MYRCALAAIVAVGFVAPAAAQVRSFPQNTLRAAAVFGEYPNLTLNGKAVTLSPGSRVRDQQGRIVMAASLAGQKLLVHYTVDIGAAQLRDVWVLTADEAAIRPWPTTLEEAQTWTFDTSTMSWVKP